MWQRYDPHRVFWTVGLLLVCTTGMTSAMAASAGTVPTATLNNGRSMPLIGLGTWKSEPGPVKAAVKAAITMGYRHIDCAHIYGNEKEIGEALAEVFAAGICNREDLFVTSKLWNDSHGKDEVMPALETTLANLQLDYLDMYLIHWPVAMPKGTSLSDEDGLKFYSLKDRPILATWQGMEACVKAGLCRGIGVSNFSVKKLKELLSKCTILPAINQVECHPYFQQGALLKYCQSKKIHLTCYSPLGSLDRPEQFKAPDEPRVLDDPTLHAIATSLGASPAQVILKWAMQRGTSTIPKSVHPGRMKENWAAATSALADLEPDAMQVIADLDRNLRLIDGTFWTSPEGSPYTLENLWDEDE